MLRNFSAFALLAVAASGLSACTDAGASRDAGAAGLLTVFDSTADSIIARSDGEVATTGIRRLVEEMRIAPSIDDTSLFTDVADFEVDLAGRLWVYDRPSSRIFIFSRSGDVVRVVGRRGSGPGEFLQANGMVALPDSGIAVWDSQNARISFFSSDGSFQTSWRTPAGFSTNNGLVTDRSGTFYLRRPVTPPREGEILGRMGLVRLADDGAFRDSLVPVDIDVPRETYVAERRSGRDNVSRSATSSSFAPSYMWQWHPDGFFAVGHGGKYEIILDRDSAPPVVIHRTMPIVGVLPDEHAEEEARILFQMRQLDPAWAFRGGSGIPETKAPLQQIAIARDGRIWARVATESERIPEAELDAPREKGPPVRHFRAPSVWEIFSAQGTFLGRVPLPWRTTWMDASGDLLWAIVRDEDDLPAVVRFRIEPALR